MKFGGFKFMESAHIKDLLAHLRVVANPKDTMSWNRLLLLVPGVGRATCNKFNAQVQGGFTSSRRDHLARQTTPTPGVKGPGGAHGDP